MNNGGENSPAGIFFKFFRKDPVVASGSDARFKT